MHNLREIVSPVEIQLPDCLAFSNVVKESINRLLAAVVESITSNQSQLFKLGAILYEVTQPAELLTALRTVCPASVVSASTDGYRRKAPPLGGRSRACHLSATGESPGSLDPLLRPRWLLLHRRHRCPLCETPAGSTIWTSHLASSETDYSKKLCRRKVSFKFAAVASLSTGGAGGVDCWWQSWRAAELVSMRDSGDPFLVAFLVGAKESTKSC